MSDNKFRGIYLRVMSYQHTCYVAGTRKLTCIVTLKCWCNRKFVHCTKKYWGINTTNGVMSCRSICPVLLPPLYITLYSLFHSLLLPFTRRFRSFNLLFLLLVFVFASQSLASYCYCLSCFVPTLFN